jgi:hypothetical protein
MGDAALHLGPFEQRARKRVSQHRVGTVMGGRKGSTVRRRLGDGSGYFFQIARLQ